MMQSFLEFAVPAPAIQASLAFYESLGFVQAVVGETWDHDYAVIADARLLLGLHGERIDEITPTFVHTGLLDWHRWLEMQGLRPERAQLDAESFNRIELRDADGGAVLLVEARTYSPPPVDPVASRLGFFAEYTLPTRNLAAAGRFWETLGLIEAWRGESPHAWVRYTGSGISLGVHENTAVAPGLMFCEADMPARIEALRALGHVIRAPGRRPPVPHCLGLLAAPEGTLLYLCDEGGLLD
jgi:catechol 2,3-dioxygenase-like lactoylglutathione lyase family enzyme